MPTPFGTVYSTNITPDPDTGNGRWSEAAFVRAMREGIARDGSQLLPALPFDQFTKITDDDAKALYALLATRQPIRARSATTKQVSEPTLPVVVRITVSKRGSGQSERPSPRLVRR